MLVPARFIRRLLLVKYLSNGHWFELVGEDEEEENKKKEQPVAQQRYKSVQLLLRNKQFLRERSVGRCIEVRLAVN